MKIIAFSLCLFVSITAYGQKPTFAELKGVWRQAWTIDIIHNSYLDFVDSGHVVKYNYIKGDDPSADTVVFTYTIDNSKPITLIHLFNPKYVDVDYYWFIKLENGILKAQGDFDGKGVKPTNWDNHETMKNTAPFYKTDKVGSLEESPNHKQWIENEIKKLEARKN